MDIFIETIREIEDRLDRINTSMKQVEEKDVAQYFLQLKEILQVVKQPRTNREKTMDQSKKTEMFEYLDLLKNSGLTNMFGAGSYLEEEFRISNREARDVLAEWMRTFSKRKADSR